MRIAPELQIFTTGDGSPTLAFRDPSGRTEKMHHSGGAFTESLYIYHHGLKLARESGCPPRVISVGLGLGYNELIALAELSDEPEAKIWSFEALPYLREQFARWASAPDQGEYDQVLNNLCARIEAHFGVADLRDRVKSALASGRLELREAFPEKIAGIENVGVVFFDAYSNKMSPELWREAELQAALKPVLSKRALLCTYAATGSLNRVLKNLGFKLLDRPGFQGKRESTLALRD